ncbi:MAG: CPBP family intramembrane glutamic endopeptidase [Gemmatimonadales bacterium]
MNPKGIFFGENGALRAPWRIAVFCALSLIAVIGLSWFAQPVMDRWLGPVAAVSATSQSWVETLGLLAGTAITLRLVDGRSWSDVWLGRDAARPTLLAFGFAIGALAIGLPILLLLALHWLRNGGGAAGSWFAAAARLTIFLAPAALLEELLTRGYILCVLRDAWGWRWAIAVTSVAFGLLHVANNGATAGSVLLVTLAGFFLATVLYVTRSLYAAWMAHLAWNWTMAVVFHAAVSGYPMEAPGYRYVDAGPDWATGGPWGPEGGVPAGLGMCAGIAYLLVRRRRSAWTPHSDDSRGSSRELADQET